MHVGIQLFVNRFKYSRVAMPNIGYTYPANQIQIFLTVYVIQFCPYSFAYFDTQWSGRSLGQMPDEYFSVCQFQRFVLG